MIKKIKYLYLFMITFLIGNHLVLANTFNHTVDFNKTGSVTITLKESNDNTSVEGAELTIYQIANATSIDSNLTFVYHENIKDCDGDLSDISNQSLISEIEKCLTNVKLPKQTKLTNQEGLIKFDNLGLGLYLVKQTNKVEGYSIITPFLVTLPKEENNKWIYDIESLPKTDIIRLMDLFVEKRWDTINSNNTPKEVTIELLKSGKIIDTVILNNENNWTHTWTQIEKSDAYSVLEINIPEGYTATYRQIENKFIVTNTKTLVQTGQNIILIELFASIGLIFIITGITYEKRKNHEQNR